MNAINVVNYQEKDRGNYTKHLADCVILAQDGRLYLQRRPENWRTHAGKVNLFGGHVEDGENIIDAVIREIYEETGAKINATDLIYINSVTESETNHTELVHIYFWEDKAGEITGCYEAEPIYFNSTEEATAHLTIMPYAAWALMECQKRGIIK